MARRRRRRSTPAGQLFALQVAIIAVVLGAVAQSLVTRTSVSSVSLAEADESADAVGATGGAVPLLLGVSAELVGISRVSVRRHLEHYVTMGQADVRLGYGSTGRPERRYRWMP